MDGLPVASTSHAFYAYPPHPHQPRQHYHEPSLAPLAYRPLHVPVQASERRQQHLLLAHVPPGYQQRPNSTTFQACRHLCYHPRPANATMASFQQHATTDEELAEFQKLSNEYQPEATGPLVGQRQPSTAITTEYALADPVFQAKTAALPQKYSHYRTVRGDGCCGWRAIAFGYFEALIHHGDPDRCLEEEGRLRSTTNIVNLAGFPLDIYEDFTNFTYDLLRKLADAMRAGTAEDVLLDAFNDETTQNYIMTHLKTLTASWMKTRPEDYAPWLGFGQTVEEYCNVSITPTIAEIDNVGLSALKDAFLSPAGITLEVLYLDRSEGSEVNMHSFPPVTHGDVNVGTIRLLYRPGHYDLLYKLIELTQPAAVAVPAAPIATYLQYAGQPRCNPATETGVFDFMAGIPGMTNINPHEGWTSYNTYSDLDCYSTRASIQHCSQALPTPAAPAPQPDMKQHYHNYTPPTPARLVPQPSHNSKGFNIAEVPPSSMLSHDVPLQKQHENPFRPSVWEWTPDFVQATSQANCQTAQFLNSPYNRAHFMNPDFEPERWHPTDDDNMTSSSKSSRHRNNSG